MSTTTNIKKKDEEKVIKGVTHQQQLSRVHAFLTAACAEPSYYPGLHLKNRVRCLRERQGTGFGTWRTQGPVITIGKYGRSTLVYVPEIDTFYVAGPGIALSEDFPDKTVVVGQYAVDNEKHPRVLVFDLAYLHGRDVLSDVPGHERYKLLHEHAASHLGSMCALQWAGSLGTLRADVASGKFTVPHVVDGYIEY